MTQWKLEFGKLIIPHENKIGTNPLTFMGAAFFPGPAPVSSTHSYNSSLTKARKENLQNSKFNSKQLGTKITLNKLKLGNLVKKFI